MGADMMNIQTTPRVLIKTSETMVTSRRRSGSSRRAVQIS